jgi:hypothetical protein
VGTATFLSPSLSPSLSLSLALSLPGFADLGSSRPGLPLSVPVRVAPCASRRGWSRSDGGPQELRGGPQELRGAVHDGGGFPHQLSHYGHLHPTIEQTLGHGVSSSFSSTDQPLSLPPPPLSLSRIYDPLLLLASVSALLFV